VIYLDDRHLNFYGLGSFYFSNGRRIFNGDSWISKKALDLFMYLLFKRKKNVRFEKLVDLFWPESNLERGKKKLYDTIYLLRKSLNRDGLDKNIVVSNNGHYSINNNYKIWTDWEHFDSKTDELINGEKKFGSKDLKNLFEFYRGDFFSELSYADWTEIYREKLRRKYLNLIEIMTEKMYENKRYMDALNYLNEGLIHDPYLEKFYLLKLKTLNKLGRIAEAIDCFNECKSILKEDLGVQPQHELKEELKKIKRNRDFEQDDLELDTFSSVREETGAMECSNVNEFKRIFELEMRQVQRLKDKEFLLVTLDFENNNIKREDLEATSEKIASKFKSNMRLGDYICPMNNKINIILQDMNLDCSGIIIKRFNHFFKKLDFNQKPKLDIKEID
jgi:DNA-binding SARP family transcriptional activator